MSLEKENFLRTRLVPTLQKIDPSAKPLWGKMTLQHMIEHFSSEGVEIANGSRVYENLVTPLDLLKKYRDFMLSEKPFRENTPSPIMTADLPALKFNTVHASINHLQEELIRFFEVFEKEPLKTTRNPIFGDLNFEQNVHLLHKHAVHHLNQFGITI